MAASAAQRTGSNEASVLKPKKGRRGDPQLRETVRALLRLYKELFGLEPTHTERGPTARFVAQFFEGVTAEWHWIDADAWDVKPDDGRILLIWRRLERVRSPAKSALPDLIRAAMTSDARGDETARWEISDALTEGGRCLVAGAFAIWSERGEEWGTTDREVPPLFRLLPRPVTE